MQGTSWAKDFDITASHVARIITELHLNAFVMLAATMYAQDQDNYDGLHAKIDASPVRSGASYGPTYHRDRAASSWHGEEVERSVPPISSPD